MTVIRPLFFGSPGHIPGQAMREHAKRSQYRHVSSSIGTELRPMVIDIYGHVGHGFERGSQ